MIHVIASIRVKRGKVPEFLKVFRSIVPHVEKENGCIEYVPAVDIPTDLPTQLSEENVVTVIEKWESLEALRTHLAAPHVLSYRERVREIVERVSLKVLTEA